MREAQEKAEKILSDAKKQRTTILDAAKLGAEEISDVELKKAKEVAREKFEREIVEGKMKIKREILKKREELINEAFKRAETSLKRAASGKEYEKKLVKLATEACRRTGHKDVILKANAKDLKILEREKSKIAAEIGGKVSIGEAIQTIGGVVAVSADGKVVVDETFEARLKREAEALRIKVAKLFEGSK
ncbi:MAG: V-type ATP synthase subunit E family protein [Candidatus Hadarchaeales archaeon]